MRCRSPNMPSGYWASNMVCFSIDENSSFCLLFLSGFIYAVVIVGHDHCGGVISAIDTALNSLADETSPKDYIFRDSLYQPLESVHGDQPNDTSDGPPYPRLVAWLEPLVQLVKQLQRDGKLPANPEERLKFVIGESVKLQIDNFAKLDDFVRRRAKRLVWVHGWVYDFPNGVIRDLQVTRVLGG